MKNPSANANVRQRVFGAAGSGPRLGLFRPSPVPTRLRRLMGTEAITVPRSFVPNFAAD
jgi:hypothetical protein